MADNYKSWGNLKKRLEKERLCDSLKGRVEYYYTSYHKVHNAYTCGGLRVDGKNALRFSWDKGLKNQEADMSRYQEENGRLDWNDVPQELKEKWDRDCIYSNGDFIAAIQKLFHLPIEEALVSEDMIVRMLAVLDRRTGKRTLQKLATDKKTKILPEWLKNVYRLRMEADGILFEDT